MRSLARWGALPLLAAPLGSWALGLGEIEPGSYLNQPLFAEIPLSATPDELSGLSVSMASSAEFARRGLDRPGFLSTISFSVVRNAEGQNVIRVTSTRSITEPFVTMVVEAKLPGRTQFREYTVLLDPPLFLPDVSATEPVAPPVARETAADAGAIERPVEATPAPRPAPQPAQPVAAAREPAPVQRAPAPAPDADGSEYLVQGGDTLWAIATRNRPGDATMNQTMMSIFRANPEAFVGNINRLRRGAILRIPPAAELRSMPAAEATAEVARQTAEWASGSSSAPSPALVLLPPSDEDGATIGAGAAAVEAAQAEVEAARAEIAALQEQGRSVEQTPADSRLLELESPDLANLQNQLSAGAESESSLIDEAAASSAAADAAEALVDEAGADLADRGLDAAEPALDVIEPAQVFVDESEPEAAPAAAAAAARTSAPVIAAEPTLVDRVIGFVTRPLVLILLGVLVVLAAAFAFLRRRQDSLEDVTGQWEALESEVEQEFETDRDADVTRVNPAMSAARSTERGFGSRADDEPSDEPYALDPGTVEISAPTNIDVEPESFEDDFEDEADAVRDAAFAERTLSNQTVINLDQADPIAEADFHMAYGLYDQAADLVARALESDPGSRELKLKLLEVYFVWGNKEQFLEQARLLHGELGASGGPEWDKVVIMGKQICPDETLFSGAISAAPEVDLELASGESGAAIDFSLDDSEDEVDFGLSTIDDAAIELEREHDEGEVDEIDLEALDIGEGTAETREAPAAAAADGDDDFMLDIGERTQAGLEAAFLDLDADDDGQPVAHDETAFDIGSDESLTEESFEFGEAVAENEEIESISLKETREAEVAEGYELEEQDEEMAELEDLASVSMAGAASAGGDTIEHLRPASMGPTEMTTELELDDLGLDVSDIRDLPPDLGEAGTAEFSALTLEQPGAAFDADEDDLLSATGVTEVLKDDIAIDIEQTGTLALDDDALDDDDNMLDDEPLGVRTEVLEQPVGRYGLDTDDDEAGLDLNLDDFSSALDGGVTAEQPGLSGYGIDLDVGNDILGDDDPTGTEDVGGLDPQTMTEVGTKLDLARAYIDMGDPEGAKSILEEVITEGDSGQRSEARALINALPV